MKYLLFFLLMQTTHAGVTDSFTCAKDVNSLASEWKATGKWTQEQQGGLSNSFYASPTDKIGDWVLTKEIPNGAVISKVDQAGRIEVTFTGKDCKKDVKSYAHPAPKAGLKTDKDIENFVTSNKSGIIYVWSPRMQLSQSGISEIQKASKDLKLPLLVLLDKKVSEQELKSLKKKLGNIVTERVDSLEFKMRNVEQHYPAVLVFKDSKILPEVKYGFEKSGLYQSDVTNMLARSSK